MAYTVVATDPFTAADNTAWESYRASNYTSFYDATAGTGYAKILSNRLVAGFSMLTPGAIIVGWAGAGAGSIGADHGAEVTVQALAANADGRFYEGPALRLTAGTGTTANGYLVRWTDGPLGTARDIQVVKLTNSVETLLRTTAGASYFDGQTLRGEIVGQRIAVVVGGTEIDAYTDAGGYASGIPGWTFLGASGGAGPEIDQATFGNVGTASGDDLMGMACL